MDLREYINRDRIIAMLIKYRANFAHTKHKQQLITHITKNKEVITDVHKQTNSDMEKEVFSMMPPRREWILPDEKARGRHNDSLSRNVEALRRTIKLQIKKKSEHKWLLNLNNFVDSLVAELLSGRYRISKPEPVPIVKKVIKGKIFYRPIGVYGLKDRIVISLISKYLTDCFDWNFKETNCAYAFRSTLGLKKSITHHDAIARIRNYVDSKKEHSIFVAETDIRKFYDCVEHKKAVQSFNNLAFLTKEKLGYKVDSIAESIFLQYLSSYSFMRDVYIPSKDQNSFKFKNRIPGEFEWEENALKEKFYPDGIPDNIGVPQGGAISCLIANLMLDNVDKKLLNSAEFNNDTELLYVRYCDDMIIMHTNQEKCKLALKLYEQGLSECNLLNHEYLKKEEEFFYDRTLYDAKAKPVYKLGRKNSDSCPTIPWVAFVGYQIRYDGLVRVRKSSLLKEKKKQKIERLRVMESLGSMDAPHKSIQSLRIKVKNVSYRLEQRYVSMSVGRIKLYKLNESISQGLCWTNGFKELGTNFISRLQLKELDRSRRFNLSKLINRLKYLGGNSLTFPYKDKQRKMDMSIFTGHPFSYHSFWQKVKNK